MGDGVSVQGGAGARSTSARVLWLWMRALESREIASIRMLERLQLSPGLIADGNARVGQAIADGAARTATKLAADSELGWAAGAAAKSSDLGVVGYLIANAGSLREALGLSAQYGRLLSDVFAWRCELKQNRVVCFLEPRSACAPETHDMLLGVWAAMLDPVLQATQSRRPVVVRASRGLAAGEPGALAIRARCVLILDDVTLDTSNQLADPALQRLLLMRAEELLQRMDHSISVAHRVQDLILAGLDGRQCPSLDEVAEQMNISSATLSRRLRREGTSFRVLLDEIRRSLALEYLQRHEISARTVGARLGFAHTQSFYTAFKRWTGALPGDFRSSADGAVRKDPRCRVHTARGASLATGGASGR